jgi:hypothetical protein
VPLSMSRVFVRGCRERVLAAEADLRLLASRLHCARPLTVHGIAKVRVLLADGSGPLYHRGSAENLGTAIRKATAALGRRDPGSARAPLLQ